MNKPNLIFIVSDQHRGDWMGCAGGRLVDTPNMDRMAGGGVHFTRAYCNSPLCVPSRMSMLTGLLPHHTDVFSNSDTLRSDRPTLAHALGLGGYDTVLCGRMHFVGPDQRHGYRERLVGDMTHGYLGGPRTDYGELRGASGQGLRSIRTAGPGHSPVLAYDEQVAAACERYIDERANAGIQDGCAGAPLFMTVGFYGPHHPYVCPQTYYDRALAAIERFDDRPTLLDTQPAHPWYADWRRRLQADEISEEERKVARAAYAGLISLTDTYVGRILEAARRLPGDTWVIYVSDHGDMAGDRGMFWKRNMLEGAIRVPMIWYPLAQQGRRERLAAGRQVDAPVSLADLAPTLAAIAEAPPLPRQDGDDLLPLLLEAGTRDAAKWRERPLFVELANRQDGVIRAVIRDGMKLVDYAGYEERLLFDLRRDPQEMSDVWRSPAYADVRTALERLVTGDDWDAGQIRARLAERAGSERYLTRWGKTSRHGAVGFVGAALLRRYACHFVWSGVDRMRMRMREERRTAAYAGMIQ